MSRKALFKKRSRPSRPPAVLAALDEAAALYQSGRFAEALALAEAALPSSSHPAQLLNLAAISAIRLGRRDLAEKHWRTAIQVQPGYAEAHYNLGILFRELKRFPEAEAAYRQAIVLQPGYGEAHYNLSNLFRELERFPEAEASCCQAIAFNPGHAEAHNNLGILLRELKRFSETEAAYRQAIALKPGYAEAHHNLGILLSELKRFEEAEAAYRQAIVLQPGGVEVQANFGLFLLKRGRLEEAWPLYEMRYHPENKERRTFPPSLPFPQWQGESLAGKSILVYPEQGFGDEIQFARYLPLLKAWGASRVTLACKPPLRPLLQTVAGVDRVVVLAEDHAVEACDFWTFPLSLPLRFHTTLDTIPAALPYLAADPELVKHWRPRLPPSAFRVGLVWKGSGIHKNDSNRSLPGLSFLAPLWSVPEVSFVSLQKGQGEEEALCPPQDQPLLNLGVEIRDFADTAAIISQLDLVICVDTAIAHLAGALGKPCWVLLPAIGTDWRWLQERADSPWYPGVMRLFRQEQGEDGWGATVARVAAALGELRQGSSGHATTQAITA
ncbi:MAG: hypothetical protein A2520_09505 [Deltaproteobacteria bacterium RIFOXYD12_FULL_53_23]|nr:MAG: hypothetical protein A2520_09505 [Deltaproteobacteria bacterium RIFOXYD12_FULL_53_23]